MGYDLYGIKPKIKEGSIKPVYDEKDKNYYEKAKAYEEENVGDYFRNNCWAWRPLWDYVSELGILTQKEREKGWWNNGDRIPESKAIKIADELDKLLKSGEVARYVKERDEELENLPDEGCELCHGTGIRNDEHVKGKCNACEGKGKRRPIATWYGLDVKNVENFSKFCRESGGFEIC